MKDSQSSTSKAPQYSRDVDALYPDLSTPLNPPNRINTRIQHVIDNCYGRGMRLCDIKIPAIPKSCHHLLDGKGTDSAAHILKEAQGRGRVPSSRKSPQGLERNVSTAQSAEQGDRRDSESKEQTHNEQQESHKNSEGSETKSKESRGYKECQISSEEEEFEFDSKELKCEQVKGHGFESLKCGNDQEFLGNDPEATSLSSPSVCWSLGPPNVCQIDGLPNDFDHEILEDVVSFYSSITDSEKICLDGTLSIRYRLVSSDACELLSSSLNDADLFGIGSHITCTHVSK